jgi:predicted transcriptional regulator
VCEHKDITDLSVLLRRTQEAATTARLLRDWMRSNGVSARDIADTIGVREQTIHNYLTAAQQLPKIVNGVQEMDS